MEKPPLKKTAVAPDLANPGGGINGSFSYRAIQQLKLGSAFDPHSRTLKLWDQLLFLCFLFEAFLLPFAITFPYLSTANEPVAGVALITGVNGDSLQYPALSRAFYGSEVLFVLDFYVRFNTGYYADGNIHRDKRQARRNYVLSVGFVLDLIAILPLALLLEPTHVSWAWLEVHKVARAWRLSRYFVNLDDLYAKHFMLLKLLKVVVATAFVAHVFACSRFAFYAPEAALVPHAYTKALYWSLGLITGELEGALPTDNGELGFDIAVACSGYALFIYMCATFFVLSKSESNQALIAQARINQLKHLLSFHHVPEALQDEAVEYIQRHYTDAESNDRGVMKLLCPSITKDIQVQLLKGMMARIPLFRGCNEQFIVALTSLLELTSYAARVTLFNSGDRGDYMYVVNSGILHIFVNSVKVRELRKGDFFGEVSVFSARPRTATVTTASYCTLYRLSRFHVERVLEGYPDYAALIAVVIDGIVNQRQAAMAQGKSAAAGTYDDTDFMLTTLYQLSTKQAPPKRRRQSLLQPTLRVKKPSLHRSKSSQNLSSRRDADLVDGYDSDARPGAALVAASNKAKGPIRKLVRSKSVFARRLSKGIKNGNGNSSANLRIGPGPDKLGYGVPQQAIQGFYDNLAKRMQDQAGLKSSRSAAFARSLLLSTSIDHSSAWRMWWLLVLQIHLVANWVCIPLLLVLPDLDVLSGSIVAFYVVMDVLLAVDMYLSLHLSYTTPDREKIMDSVQTATNYIHRGFLLDVICAFPFEIVLAFTSIPRPAFLRLPRLARAWRLGGHLNEANYSFAAGNATKLALGAATYLMSLHLVACLHTAFVAKGNESDDDATPNATVVSNSPIEQYTWSLYFATATITTLGKYTPPTSTFEYAVALILMLCGFFATAVVVDNVQKRFTLSAVEQKEFLIRRARIQKFLRSQVFPTIVHQRVNAFLDFWWFSHRGAVAGELVSELPDTIKRPILRSMCHPALQTLSLLSGVRDVLDNLQQAFVDNAKFILYGQGEVVYRQGEYASGLYFLLEGEVIVIADGTVPCTLIKGGFIGTASLHLSETSVSFSERVTARTGCVMVFLSREHLDDMHKVFPTLSMALKALEKRLQASKLTKADEAYVGGPGGGPQLPAQMTLETRILRRLGVTDLLFDPDDTPTSIWKAWVFYLIVAQSFKVIMNIGFRVSTENQASSDSILVLIEIFFVLDLYFYSRLGYYEYGNKIMDCRRIRTRYFHSAQFVIDVIALIPLFLANWMTSSRYELVNMNKLLRLSHLPRSFRRLEQKHLNLTLVLRVFKLLLYCHILSHLLGCVWFSFGLANSMSPSWLPPASLISKGTVVQYLASLFWSFGVISGSNLASLPETPQQCVYTVVVLLCGIVIFSVVVGHLSDVAELVNADTRDFNAKLSSLRHLLRHFRLPLSIESKLKTHYFFQRYHTITQEHILERCLPPSLLTEIRLVHLHPMINKVAFLAGMEGSVTRMLVAQFCQMLVVKDEFVFRYGEEGNDMYFIFTGIIEIFVPAETLRRRRSSELKLQALKSPEHGEFHSYFPTTDPSKPHAMSQVKKVNELTAGGYFGEVAMFTSNPRSAHSRSKTSCVLYKLSRRSLELVFDRYPDWKSKVVKIVNIQQEQQHLKNLYMQEQQEPSSRSASANQDEPNEVDVRPTSSRVKSFAENVAGPVRSRRRRMSSVVSSTTTSVGSFVFPKQAPLVPSKSMRLTPATDKESMTWIDRLLQGTDAQSTFHIRWLLVICVATIVMAVVVPYRIAFDELARPAVLPLLERAVEGICELLFAADIWLNWNMKDSPMSMELYQRPFSKAYKDRQLWVDAFAAFPIDHFLADFYVSPALRINRCLKLINFPHYMAECSRRSIAYERTRVMTIAILWLVLAHWCACTYYVVANASMSQTSSWNSWAPPSDIMFVTDDVESPSTMLLVRRFLRSLFFAAAVLLKRGKIFTPDDALEYCFTIAACVAGFFLLAFLVSEVATLYVSYINNEVDFRTMHIAVDAYLDRWQIGSKLKSRCHAFLSSLWSSHRGVDYRGIFDELPPVLRTESIVHIAQKPLHAFCASFFRPFATMHPQDRDMESLVQTIAQHLRYQGYPRDENVVIEGSVTTEMYFVARGSLVSYVANSTAASGRLGSRTVISTFAAGDFFGEDGLLGYAVAPASVRSVSACDLLALTSEELLQVLLALPLFHAALGVAVASYRELSRRSRERDDLSSDWGDVLLDAIQKQRAQWAEGAKNSEDVEEDSWRVTGVKGGQPLGLLHLETPTECLKAFDNFVRLIVARGVQSDRMSSMHSSNWYFPDSLPFLSVTMPTQPSTTEVSDSSFLRSAPSSSLPRTDR